MKKTKIIITAAIMAALVTATACGGKNQASTATEAQTTTVAVKQVNSTSTENATDKQEVTEASVENTEASNEEVKRAAETANADSFISRLPKGYNTLITGDGENLSQGQRQLLAIARAAVADPSILILDEATSSVDTRTEALIEKGMDRLMKGRTVFIIAHRLSTVRNADKIIVLEHGEIAESGNHEELLRARGIYYKLCSGLLELS